MLPVEVSFVSFVREELRKFPQLAWKGIGDGSDVAMFQTHLLEELQKPGGQAIPAGSWRATWKSTCIKWFKCINSPAPDKYQKTIVDIMNEQYM